MQLGIEKGRGKRGKRGRPARHRVLGLSPEQRHERFLEYQRTWQRANREKLRKKRIAPKPVNHFSKKHERLCAVCLYRVGMDVQTISEKLNITPTNVRRIVVYAGVRRGRVRPVRRRLSEETIVARSIVQNYRREASTWRMLDESRHWGNHPEFINWFARENARKHAKIRLERKMEKFKCQFCGCDASKIHRKRRRAGLKYCSDVCNKKARIVAEKRRLQSDPGYKKRKRAYAKICYDRKRRERPEVYRDEIRRKEANPRYRIAKILRCRLYGLVRRGLMNKTRNRNGTP